MFEVNFTTKDAVRAAWAFVFGALGYVLIAQPQLEAGAWRAIAIGAVAAGLSAAKNLLLADGTVAKG